jgi:phosphoribosyl 1,2-cyclic phosphodiesterase
MKAGIDVYVSHGTAEALGLSGHRLHFLKAKEQATIGPWTVRPFATVHDAAEPLGFLLAKGKEKLLFATDTHYLPNRFRGLTHIMIEAGFSADILRENIAAGLVHPEVGRRALRNHMSIETALGVLRANDMSRVREIHLLHLSNHNSDAEAFARAAREVSGRPVYVAEA